ncbi:MAG: hypothetical protein EOP49_34780 [Sphingobacteriales bacterium]|nr:MAG: hypothetical protein EOP49_34780 [Sphingobacteriales bacterium]
MKTNIILILSLVALLASCTKKPNQYPDEPQIYHLSTTPDIINLNDTAALVKIELRFTDGNGDIGRDSKEETYSIYVRDSRDTSTAQDYSFRYPFPYVADYMRPKKGGLEGFITLNLGRDYFSVSDSLHLALRKDTLNFKIYIRDDAGNISNVVDTDPIYIEF